MVASYLDSISLNLCSSVALAPLSVLSSSMWQRAAGLEGAGTESMSTAVERFPESLPGSQPAPHEFPHTPSTQEQQQKSNSKSPSDSHTTPDLK